MREFEVYKNEQKKIEELNILKSYASTSGLKIVSLTGSNYSNHLLKNSDYSMTLISNKQETKELCHKIINSNNPDNLFKEVNKLYHSKNMNEWSDNRE